jgi:uncharacterized pyridoxal phosphate-containing UPF0001 family protein
VPISPSDSRRHQLSANLVAVRERVERACVAAHRAPAELTLIAVTKFFPVSDAVALVELGVTDLGESRDQDAAAKAAAFAALTDAPVSWHFVGQLQTNKARSVARYADVVHSVDRAQLVTALSDGVRRALRPPLRVLIQVSLEPEFGSIERDHPRAPTASQPAEPTLARGGALPSAVAALAEQIEAMPDLLLAGVMAVAPVGRDPDEAFAEVAELARRLRVDHPSATVISAGMSGDLEAAVRHGATHLRIGTALLGRRTPTFG